MKIVISVGPTDNRRLMFAPRFGRMVQTAEYRAWKEEATLLASRVRPKTPLTASYEAQRPYRVKCYLKDKRTDQANYDKLLRDVLTTAKIWEDDKWFFPVYTPCEIDKLNPRLEIEIL